MNLPQNSIGKSNDYFAPATILIVDDELLNRKLLTGIFDSDQYHLLVASNGAKAIRLAISERPDIILLDIIMPKMDGYTVCDSLKDNKNTASIPIILITALHTIEDEAKGFSHGAVDYIRKPFDPIVIKARVNAQLQMKRYHDTLNNSNAKLQLVNTLLEQEIEDRLSVEQKLVDARDEIKKADGVKEGVIKDLFQVMCEMLSSRDLYTFEHGMRVASIARLIAEEMNLNNAELDALELGCMLHDISKVAIPDDVLLKPGLFDAQDRKIMRLHPAMGARIFRRQSCDPRIIDIIHHHHERLDGSGYPDGLKDNKISLLVRIAMVADTYEAMVSRRPYKKPLSRSTALDLMRKDVKSGRLDSDVVEVLYKVTKDWDPLDQVPIVSDESTKALEIFRKKTYFKEPLSDFYNYRYLFFLEKSGLLECSEHGYSLFRLEVTNLDQIKNEYGYFKVDQIVDEAGSNLHEGLFSDNKANDRDFLLILMRKGSTYLVYTNCQGVDLTTIDTQIEKCVRALHSMHGINSEKIRESFTADVSIEEALYQLLAA